MNPKCIYEVKTKCFGTVRLDEGAYKDFLAGRSWLCYGMSTDMPKADAPANISDRALQLRSIANKQSPFELYSESFETKAGVYPYSEKNEAVIFDDETLSVRSRNALRRSNVRTLGELYKRIKSDEGLKSIRNLGAKSEAEVLREFFNYSYLKLNEYEQAAFWQKLIDSEGEKSK